jgi:hypothetical protein
MCSGSGERGNWTSAEVFQRINSLLDQLSSEDLNSLPASAMGEDQIALQRIENRVKAEALRRLRRFDSGQGYASTLALSAKAWLRWKCNLSYPAASNQVEVARALDSLPQTTQAFADGDISYQHTSLIARTSEQLGERMEAHAEEILVDAANKLDPFNLRKVTAHLLHCLKPDEVLRDANEAHEKRFLYMSQTMDGVFYLNGRLDAEAERSFRQRSTRSWARRPRMTTGQHGSAERMRQSRCAAANSMPARCQRLAVRSRTWLSTWRWRR